MLVLLVLGCGAGPGEKALEYNFKQGIAEVQLRTLENAPPEKIYPNTPFKIIVEMDNQAAYDATEGVVRIVGLDNAFFRVDRTEQSFAQIVGRSALAPEGEKVYLEFDGAAGQLFQNSEEYVNTFFLKTKYNSRMEFTDTVCINTNLYAVYDSGCAIEPVKSYSGQGAPLAVSEVEEIITPGAAVEFRIHVANEGEGSMTMVHLGRTMLGGEELTCEFQDVGENKRTVLFTPEKQEATLICRKFLRDQSSYTTTLLLTFSYDYEIKKEQRLRLVR